MGKRTEESLLEQFRIDEFEIEQRKSLFGFSPSDAELLLMARPHILPELDAVVEVFYRHLTGIEAIAAIIGDRETMRRLRIAQRRYVDDLFSGIYDDDYVNDRLCIGFVHKRIGVEPKYYLSGLSVLRTLLHAAVDKILSDAVRAASVKAALEKLLLFDTALVFDSYLGSMRCEIEAVKEGALRYARALEDKVAERTRELEVLSRQDALTGLLNRRALYEALRRELARARRASTPIAVLYIDVDDFKAVNDSRGHQKGDEALRTLAAALSHTARENDTLARLGGDEFCAVLPDVDAGGASAFATRFVEALRERDRSLSVSIGMYCTGPVEFDEPEALLNAADVRMYEHKAQQHSGQTSGMAALAGAEAHRA